MNPIEWKYQTRQKKKTDNDRDVKNTQNGTGYQDEVREHLKKKINFVDNFSFMIVKIFFTGGDGYQI